MHSAQCTARCLQDHAELTPLEFILRGAIGARSYGLQLIPGYHLRMLKVQGSQFGSCQVRNRLYALPPCRPTRDIDDLLLDTFTLH